MREVEYRKFNTGDQIWLQEIDGKMQVTKLISANGYYWEEGCGPTRKFWGPRLWWCYIVAACIRFCYECQRELNP